MSNIKLFCIPYSGGSASVYLKWKRHLDNRIQLFPLELAGRGSRYNELYYKNLDEAVNDLLFKIINETDINSKFAVYGHSLGGIIAYELVYKLQEEFGLIPSHSFFSGVEAPTSHKILEPISDLPDDEFVLKIFTYGGTPKELLENKSFLGIYLPIIRADMKIYETYNFVERAKKLESSISIINGKEDILTIKEIEEWRFLTKNDCNFYCLDGDHFFINTYTDKVANIINYMCRT